MIKWHVCSQERTLGVHMKANESALIAYNVTVLMFLFLCKIEKKFSGCFPRGYVIEEDL